MKALTITIALLAAGSARAETLNFAALDEGTNVVTVSTGAEHGVVVGAGYSRVTAVADRPLVLTADLTVDVATIHDARLRAGAQAPVLRHGPWNVIGGLTAIARGTSNDVAQMIDVGTDVALLAGRYVPRWFVAAEVGFDWAFATHIDHTAAYRMLIYPDARDGWYGNTGGLFRVGLQAGISFAGNDLIVRAGTLRDDGGNPPLFPIYATVSYDRRW